MRKDLFDAIADPTRREIIRMVSENTLNIGSIAENFNVSRTAIYKHIKILTECGLIRIRKNGRERYCEPKLEKLQEIVDWVEQYKKYWMTNLDSLDSYLKQIQKEKNKKNKKNKKRNSK